MIPKRNNLKLVLDEHSKWVFSQGKIGKLAYLSHWNLDGADLETANFEFAKLRFVTLKEASLSGANFRNAELIEVNLFNARIDAADFEGAHISEVNFSFSEMEEACYVNANLEDVNFEQTNLDEANFEEAKLRRVNFKNAILSFAEMTEAEFEDINFEGADFEGANLDEGDFSFSKCLKANFADANLEGANFEGVDLSETNFTKAILRCANFKGANLLAAEMKDADIEGANFQGANLKGTNFEGADLFKADFDENYLIEIKIDNINLPKVDCEDTKSADSIKNETKASAIRPKIYNIDQIALNLRSYIKVGKEDLFVDSNTVDPGMIEKAFNDMIEKIRSNIHLDQLKAMCKHQNDIEKIDKIEFEQGDIVPHNGQVACRLDFKISISYNLSLLLDRKGKLTELSDQLKDKLISKDNLDGGKSSI